MPEQMQLNKIGIYMRLSRDDEKASESMSIENQRIILRKYVDERGGTIVDEYVDDGYSGTNFDRPSVKRLLSDAQEGIIDTIIVKDLSRFGRNYIQVGQYIDYIFPAYGIRFIALNDNVDTADRSSTAMDMMPIMNVFNEWHAANTSRKIRAVFDAKQRAGKYTNWNYPFGYRAGTDENRTAIIDEPAAKIVRRIYAMRMEGISVNKIARILTDEGVPNPTKYFTRLDGAKSLRQSSPHWYVRTVRKILTDPTYLGTMTQHKTTTVSYKNHQIVNVPQNEWIVRENAHEPIISRDVWDKVQTVNNSVSRGLATKEQFVHPLSGLVVCPDCGAKLKLQSYGGGKDRAFLCKTYKDWGTKYCTSHFISAALLEQIVLQDIRAMLKRIEVNEDEAKEAFLRERAEQSENGRYSDERQLKAYRNRLAELDKLIRSAFEEKVLRGMPESVCNSLCASYEEERSRIERGVEELEARLVAAGNEDDEADEYVAKVKQYIGCETLTREMCIQLIEFISVGERTQDGSPREIQIHYKFKDPVADV